MREREGGREGERERERERTKKNQEANAQLALRRCVQQPGAQSCVPKRPPMPLKRYPLEAPGWET